MFDGYLFLSLKDFGMFINAKIVKLSLYYVLLYIKIHRGFAISHKVFTIAMIRCFKPKGPRLD